MRPRIKFPHRPVRFGEEWIRIGGIVRGIASDIHDPDGWVWALLEALDGMSTVDQVVADLVHRYPGRPEEHVREAIDDLVAAGYIDSCDRPIADDNRYSRGLHLTNWMTRTPDRSPWDIQLEMFRARVTVVGLGGVGATAALELACSGIGQLHCVDYDVVELSNLNRQVLYTEGDIGRAKSDVAVSRLRLHNSEVQVTGEQLYVDGPAVLTRLAAGCDVLVLAADYPSAIRSWTNRACLDTGTAWVHGGYHGPQVNVGLYRPGTGPCQDCGQVARRLELAAGPRITHWSPGRNLRPSHAANAITAGMAGGMVAHAVMSLVTGTPALCVNSEYGLNLATLVDCQRIGLAAPHPDCPACG
ncbi:ThiF family adenylyltransferase [Actinokineospora globicatena]|uniref:Thiamine/molybdopterin biosynthesis protein n=1 Tax=Actinokineospora globicatena TaxID=103729 RepID=A0A9W6V9E5_9PSEU|nr:ThiF family adenylyltransferase [Actinokineospora globicatena]GLW93227.1 thiamine/molybdopterin biosynthesis protein [Actinokineospora globicatena]